MANTMIGKLHIIGDVVSIPTKSGSTIQKRTIVLDCTTYDRYTGQPNANYPSFELSGERTKLLDQFKVGDMVEVSFFLSGRQYEKDGKTNYFTSIIAYDIKAHKVYGGSSVSESAPVQQPLVEPEQQPESTEQTVDDIPF